MAGDSCGRAAQDDRRTATLAAIGGGLAFVIIALDAVLAFLTLRRIAIADAACRESEARFHLFVEAVTDYAICMLDTSGHIATSMVVLDKATAGEGVAPGPYILIAVSDTGMGMTEGVLARAFDPFFTTKEPGQGTGLGLSQVFGFIRQSGGHVTIRSRPGAGTVVNLYLPPICL